MSRLNPIVELTDDEWDAVHYWVEDARTLSLDWPGPDDPSREYWDNLVAKVRMRDLTLEEAKAVLGFSEGYVEVEADDNEVGSNSTAAEKLTRLLYPPSATNPAELKRRLLR